MSEELDEWMRLFWKILPFGHQGPVWFSLCGHAGKLHIPASWAIVLESYDHVLGSEI